MKRLLSSLIGSPSLTAILRPAAAIIRLIALRVEHRNAVSTKIADRHCFNDGALAAFDSDQSRPLAFKMASPQTSIATSVT